MKLARGQECPQSNADETLLGGTITERSDWGTNEFFNGGPNRRNDLATVDAYRGRKGQMMEDRLARHYPMELFFYNLATGKTKKVNRSTDWLGHLQFSPTDPKLLLFCHEGPWQKVDRIWTIRADGSGLQLIHQRTMTMEIAGHEFWSADGRRSGTTSRRRAARISGWPVMKSPPARGRGITLSATSGAYTSTSRRMDNCFQRRRRRKDGGARGAWKMALPVHARTHRGQIRQQIDTSRLVKPGVFHSEKLVNMATHDYALEPNAMFSPDLKWLIFRSNMSGANQVYAVELK